MKVAELPMNDKPREKLFRLGPSTLSLSELVAVILGTGVHKTDVLEVADSIVKEYGGDLNRLCVSSASEFATIPGIGHAKAAALSASLELGKRMAFDSDSEGRSFTSLKESLKNWSEKLRYEQREFFVAVYLDINKHVIDEDRVSFGGTEGAFIDSGFLLKRAVRLGAKGAAVLHNHPDGTLEASREDVMVTEFLCRQFRILDIQFFGHFVVSCGKLKRICGNKND